MTRAAITSLINAQVRSAALTAVAATINDSPNAMITKRPCRSLKCAGRMSQSRPRPSPPAPLPAASRSAPIAANQIQLRAGGSTNAPASTSVRPMSDNEAKIATDPRSTWARSRSMRTWSPRPSRRTTRYGTTNQKASDAEGAGHRRGHDERDPGGDERDDADEIVGRVGRVQRPRELGPRPPDQPEEQDRARHAGPVEMRCGERGDLRDREDEHEVEEQLDERDRLVFGTVQPSTDHGTSGSVNTGGSASRSFCRARP